MISFLSFIVALGSPGAEAAPATYNLNKGDLYVKVYKDTKTLAASQAHNHLILASNWGGSFTFDPDNPSACKLSVYVPVKEMVVDADADRKRLGGRKEFTNSISDSQRKEVRKNMLAKGQLNADQHEYITFDQSGSGCVSKGGGSYDIIGNFTLRGKSKEYTVSGAAITVDGGKVSLKGGFTLLASDHGFKPYKALMGAVANQDKMRLSFDIGN